jgi:hypothetical protein
MRKDDPGVTSPLELYRRLERHLTMLRTAMKGKKYYCGPIATAVLVVWGQLTPEERVMEERRIIVKDPEVVSRRDWASDLRACEEKRNAQSATSPLARYRQLERQLFTLRTATKGYYSPDEVRIIDAMLEAWKGTTPAFISLKRDKV